MNYQTYKLKRKMQRWLYSIEDIIYFPTRELFDRSPALQQWLKDRDQNKTHYRNIKRITQEIFQAVQVKGYALICTANLSHYSLKYYFDTYSMGRDEVREIMRTPKWGKKNGLLIYSVPALDFEHIAQTYGTFKFDATERLELQRLHDEGHQMYIIERR